MFFLINHFMFASFSDPADVVVVLLPDLICHVGTNLLQDRGSDVICNGEILGVARCAHPAKRAEAQREDVSMVQKEGEQEDGQFIRRRN